MGGRYGKYGEIKRFERLRKNRRNVLCSTRRSRFVKGHAGKLRPFKGNFSHSSIKD